MQTDWPTRGANPEPADGPEDHAPRSAPVLTATERRDLRAQAHHLDPVVMIGEAGLTPAVLAEVDRALTHHQLIKIRVLGDDRDHRSRLMEALGNALGCAPVQMIGKLLIIWRPAPEASPQSTRSMNKKHAARAIEHAGRPARPGTPSARTPAVKRGAQTKKPRTGMGERSPAGRSAAGKALGSAKPAARRRPEGLRGSDSRSGTGVQAPRPSGTGRKRPTARGPGKAAPQSAGATRRATGTTRTGTAPGRGTVRASSAPSGAPARKRRSQS